MSIKSFFKKRKYASPYFGGTKSLGTVPSMPLRKDDEALQDMLQGATSVEFIPFKSEIPPVDWDQRRFELVKMLVAQERRSVVLGKLRANNQQIAVTARKLADAAIAELMNHPYHDRGREETDE